MFAVSGIEIVRVFWLLPNLTLIVCDWSRGACIFSN